VVGAVIAFVFRIPLRWIGLIMGFGAGVLISAVAFDLVEDAVEKSVGNGWSVAGLFAGCLVFFIGDRLIDRLGGGDRKLQLVPRRVRAALRSRSCSEPFSTGSLSRW
jgi:zinc transporter, ZIP family